MSKLAWTSRIWPVAAILALLTLSLAAAAALTSSSPAALSLPPTTDSETCFQNINSALAQQTELKPDVASRLLQVAETSSQHQAFAQAGETVSLVSASPAMEYGTAPGCAGITIEAYTFSFVSGGKELSIGVDPSTMSVVRILLVPAVSWGGALNSSAYPGDASNGASSGTASLGVLLVQSTSTTSTSTVSPSTSATTSITVNNGTTTVYNDTLPFQPFTPLTPAEGQGSTAYLILAAVAVIVVLFGLVMWRRKVAGNYGNSIQLTGDSRSVSNDG
jgi:hypothetical protein